MLGEIAPYGMRTAQTCRIYSTSHSRCLHCRLTSTEIQCHDIGLNPGVGDFNATTHSHSPLLFIPSRHLFHTLAARSVNPQMGCENLRLIQKRKHANYRMISVSGFKTDLLEIQSPEPALHVLFIPGNPGVISFYTDFLESLYELLGGDASVTAIGHISHSNKNWESGRLFSLQEQIHHKISFIETELQDVEVPIILVGHSIGAFISLEIFKRSQKKVTYFIGLYPFLAVNTKCSTQAFIRRISMSPVLSTAISSIGALLGMLPSQILRFLVKTSIGKLWSASAVDVLCRHVLKYHVLRNMLFMTMAEFQMLPQKLDGDFIRGKKRQTAFLFGDDDHWGPLHIYEEIRSQAPEASVEVEREGHTHAFSCTEAGSIWVAKHVSRLIKNNVQNVEST